MRRLWSHVGYSVTALTELMTQLQKPKPIICHILTTGQERVFMKSKMSRTAIVTLVLNKSLVLKWAHVTSLL